MAEIHLQLLIPNQNPFRGIKAATWFGHGQPHRRNNLMKPRIEINEHEGDRICCIRCPLTQRCSRIENPALEGRLKGRSLPGDGHLPARLATTARSAHQAGADTIKSAKSPVDRPAGLVIMGLS